MSGYKKILLAAGGTGGHLFPAIALAEELKKSKKSLRSANSANYNISDDYSNSYPDDYQIDLITDIRGQRYLTEAHTGLINTHIIDLYFKNHNPIVSKIIKIALVIKASFKAFFLIKQLKPAVIIGFGGYPSFPALLAGKILNVPIIIYEQNYFLGKVNRFFASTARVIALAYFETAADSEDFPSKEKRDTDKYPMYKLRKNLTDNKRSAQNIIKWAGIKQNYHNKIIIVGDIVRQEIRKLPAKKDFNSDPFTILILGGSQGARIFSTLIPNTIKLLVRQQLNSKVKIIQQAKKSDQDELARLYSSAGVEYILEEFFTSIENIYMQADLVISRAGAITIAELTTIGLPAIFIPLPSATLDHQYYNAKALENINASWCFRQEQINSVILARKLLELINNRHKLLIASRNLLKRTTADGNRHLSATVLKIIHHHNKPKNNS